VLRSLGRGVSIGGIDPVMIYDPIRPRLKETRKKLGNYEGQVLMRNFISKERA